jgi:hypothetical protein
MAQPASPSVALGFVRRLHEAMPAATVLVARGPGLGGACPGSEARGACKVLGFDYWLPTSCPGAHGPEFVGAGSGFFSTSPTGKDCSLSAMASLNGILAGPPSHRFYLVSGAAASELPGYVTDHLPLSKLESSGLGSQLDEFLFVLPTWGQHEYLAALEYATSTSAGEPCSSAGATPGGPCLLRLDAVTTWEPSRSTTEVVPPGDLARVTGFASASIFRSSGPVVATLGPASSARVVRAFDSLPLGEGPGCHEDETLYEIEFWPAAGPGPHYEVRGEECAAVVLVSVGAKVLHPLSDSTCSLLKLVQLLLPPTAKATRALVGACSSQVGDGLEPLTAHGGDGP